MLGATGLVGAATLQRMIEDTRIEQVIAPTRRALPRHVKVVNRVAPVLDPLLKQAADWQMDAVICAMGTRPSISRSSLWTRSPSPTPPVIWSRRGTSYDVARLIAPYLIHSCETAMAWTQFRPASLAV